MKQMIGLIIGSMIIAAAIVFGVLTMTPLVNRMTASESLKNCAEMYHVDYNDTKTNSIVRTPIEEKVSECMLRLQ